MKARFCGTHEIETDKGDATYNFPNFVFLRWDDSLPFEAKYKLAESWVYLWTSAPKDVDHRLDTFLIGLQEIWRTETTPAIRNSVGILLESAIAVPAIPLPIEAWVERSRREVCAQLAQEIDCWRNRRKSHQRRVADLVELKGPVEEFVADFVQSKSTKSAA